MFRARVMLRGVVLFLPRGLALTLGNIRIGFLPG